MTRNLIPILLIALAGCTATPTGTASGDIVKAGAPGIPPDVAKVAERISVCQHFAGEVGGNSPERNLEIEKAFADLSCHSIDQDVAAIHAKYSGNQEVQDAITAASEL